MRPQPDFAGSLPHCHPLAFVNSSIAAGLYAFVALLWLIPDPRIERELEKREE
jgi:hypothetical protein